MQEEEDERGDGEEIRVNRFASGENRVRVTTTGNCNTTVVPIDEAMAVIVSWKENMKRHESCNYTWR